MLIYILLLKKGISYINKRYSKANDKYCPDYYKNKPENFITYLDMNSPYGGTMSKYLPYGRFKWVKTTNETVNRILNTKDNSLHRYFLEVDLDYSENLHDFHKYYPMAPEKIKIEDEMLSTYCLEIKKEHNIKSEDINKLTPNLMSKKMLFIIEI